MKMVSDLVPVLMRADASVKITVGCFDFETPPPAWDELDTNRFRLVHLGRDGVSLETLADDAHVMHLHGVWDPKVARASKVGIKTDTPWVISAHGMLNDWAVAHRAWKKKIFLKLLGKRHFGGSSGVHVTAAQERQQARRNLRSTVDLPDDHFRVIPLAIDDTLFGPVPDPTPARRELLADVPADAPILLFAGRMHPVKRIHLLIEALPKLHATGIDAHVAIAGADVEHTEVDLRQRVDDLDLRNSVHFLGFVRGETLRSLYAAADLFVLPSISENFGLVLPEALLCGTPVLTTRGVDIWQELEAAGASVLETVDADRIAEVAGQLLSDRPALSELGQQGRAWVEANLEPINIAGQYLQLYRDVIKRP